MLLVYLSDTPPAISVDALARIPDVVLIYGVLYLIFIRWLWRLRILKGWLIPFPDLEGSWKGTLSTVHGWILLPVDHRIRFQWFWSSAKRSPL